MNQVFSPVTAIVIVAMICMLCVVVMASAFSYLIFVKVN